MGFGPGDIDAIFNALRPRMLKLIQGGGLSIRTVAAPTTVAPHTHHAREIEMEPAGTEWTGYLAADDVQEGLEEHDAEKLARSGVQPMQGDLNMDDTLGPWSINNIESLHLTGGTSEAVVDGVRNLTMKGTTVGEDVIGNVRIVHCIGDDSDNEARVDGLERIVFNNEPTKSVVDNPSRVDFNTGVAAGTSYTGAAGRTSWDTLEDTLIVYVASGAGVVAIALGWTVLMGVNGQT